MSGNWTDRETMALLSIRAEDEIRRQFHGTARDAVIYERITNKLKQRGIHREKAQVISKLKSLRRKFNQSNDPNNAGGTGRFDWPYSDMCQAIWGSGDSEHLVALPSSADSRSSDNNAETETAEIEEVIPKTEECTEYAPQNSAESPQPPPEKRARKVSRMEQVAKDMKKMFAEMDKEFEEKENLRLVQQRKHEERLRKEAKEEEKEEWARQMALFRETQQSQFDLMRELLKRMTPSAPRLCYPSQRNDGSPADHSLGYSAGSIPITSVPDASEQEQSCNPPSPSAIKPTE